MFFFDKVLTPFWKTFLWLKQLFDAKLLNLETIIFQCSINYGSPTRVTRLKVAPNMADPISLNKKKKKDRSLKGSKLLKISEKVDSLYVPTLP